MTYSLLGFKLRLPRERELLARKERNKDEDEQGDLRNPLLWQKTIQTRARNSLAGLVATSRSNVRSSQSVRRSCLYQLALFLNNGTLSGLWRLDVLRLNRAQLPSTSAMTTGACQFLQTPSFRRQALLAAAMLPKVWSTFAVCA